MPKGKKKSERLTKSNTSHKADVTIGTTHHSSKARKRKHKHKHKPAQAAQVSKEGALLEEEYIDKELYVLHKSGYICLMGHWIERAANEALAYVPQHAIEKRKFRDGNPFHLTIFKAMETTSQMRQKAALQSMTALANRSRPPINLGLGMVRDNETSTRSWYCSISWAAGQQIRSEYGLPPKDFHLTLGFDVKDHHVHKGPSTLLIHNAVTTSLIFTKEQIEGLVEAAIIEARTSAERSHISFSLALAQAEMVADEDLLSKIQLAMKSVQITNVTSNTQITHRDTSSS